MSKVIRVPTPGDVIGDQFVLKDELGRGGYGVVYEAIQLGVDRKVALKMLLPRALEEQDRVIERFQREARLASTLAHPNSVTIYAFGVHEGNEGEVGLPYIAMEYLQGMSLQDHLIQDGPVGIEEATFILEQTLASLTEAHRRGIIHRDIKPDNIYLHQPPGQELVVKVLDFGIAMAYTPDWDGEDRERLTKTGMVTGTAEYIPPEMVTGERELTPAVDIYSLGCVAYQMLTGELPFHGSNPVEVAIKHVYNPVPPLPEGVTETFLGQTIYKAMSKSADDRYQDAAHYTLALQIGELNPPPPEAPCLRASQQIVIPKRSTGTATAVKSVATTTASMPQASATTPTPTRPPGPSKNVVIGLGIAALVLLVAVLGLIYAGLQDQTPKDSKPPGLHSPAPVALPKTISPPAPTPKIKPPPPAPQIKEPPKPPSPSTAQSVRITSVPTASVFLGKKALGQTPLELERKNLQGATEPLKLVAEGHKETPLDILWDTLPKTDAQLSFTMERSPSKAEEKPANRTRKIKKQSPPKNAPKTPPPTPPAPEKAEPVVEKTPPRPEKSAPPKETPKPPKAAETTPAQNTKPKTVPPPVVDPPREEKKSPPPPKPEEDEVPHGF